MEWDSMSAQHWEEMTEAEWEEMAEAEKQQEAAKDRAALAKEAVGEAVADADAEMEDAEAEPEPEIPEEELPPPLPPVEIWNLRAGQAFAAKNPGGAGAFRLQAVAVNNASALEAVVRRQVDGQAWVIVRDALPRLAALSRVELLLTLGIHAHVPILSSNLHTVEYLEACRDWTWDLQTAATQFGGTFSRCPTVKSVCQLLRKVIAGGLNHRRTQDWLLDKLAAVLADLESLKVTTAFFP